MNLLLNAQSLSQKEIVNICRFFRSTADYAVKAMSEKIDFLPFSNATVVERPTDILVAHDILDSNMTIFVVEDFDFDCSDLIARALLSTKGRAITAADCVEGLSEYLPLHRTKFSVIDNAPVLRINTKPNVNLGPGTGHFKHGSVLLVGESPGKPASLGKRDAAFFSKAASSKFVRVELNKAWKRQEEIYWVNALDREGNITDWSFIKALKPRKIIALGKVPEKHLKDAGFLPIYIPHPSFWKRFHSQKEYPLALEFLHNEAI